MLKRLSLMLIALCLIVGISQQNSKVFASTDQSESINEKLGLPIVVYGGSLTEQQKSDVQELLEVDQHNEVDVFTVDGQDIASYIGGNPNSRMFSSVKIIQKDQGEGLNIEIVSPDNITDVTKEMYANALLTAGVEDADVKVASSVKVSGHSALTGIYKAYDQKGAKLDEGRMEVANEELNVSTSLAEKEGLDRDQVSELMTEIKKAIADQDPATREEVEQIVQEQLQALNIELSEEDRKRLTDLFNQMKDLNIDFDQVRNQLDDLTNTIQDLVGDEGFWNKVSSAIESFFTSLTNFIRSLFS
ncbi:DUF1002 domain-containing protein [Thalassobacillus sp. CUG 92003]|uniref:DUF1002 domain-containing protein n=1 Tax=Thalassobacillus sp. CUG 92003 TaxID=2736641 RepID=UPI0015E7715B|nr:DUF1002 domain-containing protein [Thalassobacillus sp. CUG 92003]